MTPTYADSLSCMHSRWAGCRSAQRKSRAFAATCSQAGSWSSTISGTSGEWANFEHEIRQVLPGYEIVDLPLDHKIFTTFYEIDEIIQVPNVGNGRSGRRTWECRTRCFPIVRGIHDENGRLMVIINFNTDLGDAWEWADDPYYPFEYSKYAYEMGVNFIVYAMSH